LKAALGTKLIETIITVKTKKENTRQQNPVTTTNITGITTKNQGMCKEFLKETDYK